MFGRLKCSYSDVDEESNDTAYQIINILLIQNDNFHSIQEKQHSQSKNVRLSDMCHVFLFVLIYLDIHLTCAKCIHVAKRRVKKRGKEQSDMQTLVT